MIDRESRRIVDTNYTAPDKNYEEKDFTPLIGAINEFTGQGLVDASLYDQDDTIDVVYEKTRSVILGKIEALRNTGTEEQFAEFERRLTLAAIDELWMQHMDRMAHLREEVAFEGYAQKNPLIVYRERAYDYFIEMIGNIEHRVVK